ncbi:MAG: PPC domain-containing protein [Deltaproteobacteria bacterium]|nr:PPC domain-containing protein [Deltaproteobacteria bacterium]
MTSTTDPFTSDIATLLMFSFQGEVVSQNSYWAERSIEAQLLYTIGQLNGDRSVGRLDAVELSDIRTTRDEDGRFRSRYRAVLPVAWGSKRNLPESYSLVLPLDLGSEATEHFAERYGSDCADPWAHDLSAGNYWYYYRPNRSTCQLDPSDVIRTVATASVGADNSTGKYPEYDRIWEDGELSVVSIFGKNEDGATTDDDAGIDAYNTFVRMLRTEFPGAVTTPAELSARPGVSAPDITLEVELAPARKLRVHALLVDNVRTAGPVFDARYGELSTEADLIAYNGHAGLGSNVRALARKGVFRAGKYQIIFMNGCDTFAYVDGALASARALLNPDDPTGTRYMDIVTNAQPSYFASNARADLALIRGLVSYSAPRTYQAIFKAMDPRQIVVVTGEEDNDYEPAFAHWEGFEVHGFVARDEAFRYQTETLPAGRYSFSIAGDGDADLYARIDALPTTTAFDCRPYAGGSAEQCPMTLETPGVVHLMVRGYADRSSFVLTGRPD